VPKRLATMYSGAAALLRFAPVALALCVFGGCGGGSKSSSVSIPPTTTPAPSPSSSPTAASSFGMQCGADATDCGSGGTVIWPATQAQPGMLRLVDAGTNWSTLNTANGTYDWTPLDDWLDAIEQHEPRDVSQVFIFVPCWDSSTCAAPGVAPTGTNSPPSDLTPSGSPTFNAFVTAFVQHCSPAGNCVSDIIKYYEMWNEWNLASQAFWTGTATQLYDMVAPAVAIIRQNVPKAVILSPSTTPASPTYQTDLETWLNLENTRGKLSDWVAWHLYLSTTTTTTAPPEVQWANVATNLIAAQQGVAGWASVPWANTETNWEGSNSPLAFTCPTTYSADDCTGQIVRWQLLHASNGTSSLQWFKWNQAIGSNAQYEPAYYYMMQYVEGGTFSGPCSFVLGSGNQIWTCNFKESNGTTALFVWTPTEGSTPYTVPSGYTDYKDLSGNTTTVTASSSITIGPEPIMLEQ
jgi:hypothetical protein